MNRLVATFVLCLGALSASACGTTTASGGNTFVADTGSGNDSGAVDDVAAGTDASATDVAKTDTTMPMDTMPMDTMPMDTGPKDTGPADTGPVDTGPVDTGPSADVAAGACTNPADKTIMDSGVVADKAQSCGLQNMGNAAKAADCVKTSTGLSADCSQCFAGIFSCTMTNCIADCMGGAGPKCTACMDAKGCNAAFTTCSGVTQ